MPDHQPERPHDPEHHHSQSHLSEMELRARALESVLTQKGYIEPAALDLLIETYGFVRTLQRLTSWHFLDLGRASGIVGIHGIFRQTAQRG
jgi:hypothetical protein